MSLQIIKCSQSTNSGISSATATSVANEARIGYSIQNLGTNPLFVKEGTSASTSDFSYILAAGSGNDNGTGGKYESPAGRIYTGALSIAGTSPRYVFVEQKQ
jgi:hypothetical protein